MRELTINELEQVDGGIVFTIAAAVTVVTTMIVGAYNAGKIAGEVAQRSYQASQMCTPK